MTMISTKMSAEKAKEYMSGSVSVADDAPAYSYGTELCLDNELMERLGMTEPPPVGTVMTLTAKVVVTSIGMNQQQDGDKEFRCDLQITDMELGAAARGTKSAANALYGD